MSVQEKAEQAASALAEVEEQLNRLNALDVFAKLQKQIEAATDPIKKEVALQRLKATVQRDAAMEAMKATQKALGLDTKVKDAAKAAARAQVDAAKDVEKATKKATAEKVKGFKESFAGGLIESGWGKKVLTAYAKIKEGAGTGAGAAKLLTTALSMAVDVFTMVASSLGNMVIDGVKFATSMQAFRESTEFAMKYALGSAGAAKDTFAMAGNIAATIGASVQDVAPEIQKMFSKGLGASEAGQLVQGFADLKRLGAGNTDAILDGIMAMKKNGNNGLSMSMIAPLLAVGPAAQEKVYGLLAGKLGITTKNMMLQRQQVEARIGQLKGQKGMDALAAAQLAATGQKKAGGVEKDFHATTVQGSFERISNNLKTLFATMDTSAVGQKLIAVFNQIGDALNPLTPEGKNFQKSMEDVSTAVGEVLGKFTVKDLVAGFQEAVNSVRRLRAALDSDSFSTFATAIKWTAIACGAAVATAVGLTAALGALILLPFLLVKALVDLEAGFMDLQDSFFAWSDGMLAEAASWGENLMTSMADSISTHASKVWDALKNMATKAASTVTDLFKIGSPSKLFMSYGQWTSEGMAIGVDKGANRVQASMQTMVTPPSLGGGGGGGGAGRGAVTFNNSYNIEISGAGHDAQSMAEKVRDEVTRLNAEFWEAAAIQLGGAVA